MNKVLGFVKFMIKDHWKYMKKQRMDFIVYIVLNILILLTLYYGVVVAFPLMLGNRTGTWSRVALILNYFWGLWLYIAEQTNLQLIRLRDSSFSTPGSEFKLKVGNENEKSSKATASKNRKKGENGIGRSRVRDAWHPCAPCGATVPPRTWHCSTCGSCILRRDHHCIFAMQCIGVKNQCYFMGFLFYTALGTLYATVLSCLIAVYIQGVSFWIWLLRCVLIFYVLLFDFSLNNLLASLNFVGCVLSVGVLGYYVRLALAGQTSADHSRNISRQVLGRPFFSLKTMAEFLGPNPFLRIIWPFYELAPTDYRSVEGKRSAKRH